MDIRLHAMRWSEEHGRIPFLTKNTPDPIGMHRCKLVHFNIFLTKKGGGLDLLLDIQQLEEQRRSGLDLEN